MKKALIFALVFLITIGLKAEDLFFLNIKGKISSKSGQVFKVGDKITTNDAITFSSSSASAVVISSKRGRLILQSKVSNQQTELEYIVSNIVQPASGKLSTRSAGIHNKLDLKKVIEKSSFVIIDTTSIFIPSNVYLQDENHFFYLKYHYKGEMINKRLNHENDLLLITSKIFTVDSTEIKSSDVTDITMYHYDAKMQVSSAVGKFNPSILDLNSLKLEYSVLTKHSSFNEKRNLIEFFEHINSTYGYFSSENFQVISKKLK